MTEAFALKCEWIGASHGSPEVRETAALVEVSVGMHRATHAENTWAGSVTERPPLSAYPLALWLASNWWRLLFEAPPPAQPSVDWRASHDMAAAGDGFVWPSLEIATDGEAIRLKMEPSSTSDVLSLRYLSRFSAWVRIDDFEHGSGDFIDRVCARLLERGVTATPLQTLWSEVLEERRDPANGAYRRMEAELGFDPDAAGDDLIDRVLELSARAGEAPIHELAHAFAHQDALLHLDAFLQKVESDGTTASPNGTPTLVEALPQIKAIAKPWERGYRAADALRKTMGTGAGPVSDAQLESLIGLPSGSASGMPAVKLPMSLAIRQGNGMRILVRREKPQTRRFELARLLAEKLLAEAIDNWLPATDAATARQKVQRAFAAEFLCPIVGLHEYFQGDYSDDRMIGAGEHFGVSPLVVRQNLINAGVELAT